MPTMYAPSATAWEVHNTVKEDFDADGGPTAQVTLQCAYADRYAVVADTVGVLRAWPYGSFVNPPLARRASVAPLPGQYVQDGQTMIYEQCYVTIFYSTKSTELVQESLEPTAEHLTLDYKRFRWGSAGGDPLIEGEAPGRLMRGLTLVRSLKQVAGPLPTTILTEVGKVNTSAYASPSLGLTFAAETLLYTPPHLERTIKTDGDEGWNITFKFMFLPQTWNAYWRAKTQAYEQIYIAGGALYRNYPLGNFSDFL